MDTLSTEALVSIASGLAGTPIMHLTLAANGGNSRIYRAETASKTYALKYYAATIPGTRNRLMCEVAALQFFARHHMPCVPKFHGSEDRVALVDWMEGSSPSCISLADADKTVDFLMRFPKLSLMPDAAPFGLAAEACLSLGELQTQINRRVARLREVAAQESALHVFLEGPFAAYHAQYTAHAEAAWVAQGWALTRELPRTEQCLVPGDYGFHNVLKAKDGALTFIDFEYFGWDDPVKLVADTLLHPGYHLMPEVLQHMHVRMLKVFSNDPTFIMRFDVLMPLFSLRWALILCNEFLIEKRVNRAFAADIATGDGAEWTRRKEVQLIKAQAMLTHPALAATPRHAA